MLPDPKDVEDMEAEGVANAKDELIPDRGYSLRDRSSIHPPPPPCKISMLSWWRGKMTCDNIDSDGTVFAHNCIIFVHCAMLCLEFVLYACTYACVCSLMFILHAFSACMLLCIVFHVFACFAVSHAAYA